MEIVENGQNICANFCGGSIFNETTIITAAQCCQANFPSGITIANTTIVAGELDIDEESGYEQFKKIKSYRVHPSFDQTTKRNDICVLTLDSELTFNENVASIPLDTVGPSSGQFSYVSGWGPSRVTENGSKFLKSNPLT